jgi:hypothetical protein
MLAGVGAQIDVLDRAPTRARTAAFNGSASPAIVNTERLCAGSDDASSTRTPATDRTAWSSVSTTSGRRPSLTLGTHSMMGIHGFVLHPQLQLPNSNYHHSQASTPIPMTSNLNANAIVQSRIGVRLGVGRGWGWALAVGSCRDPSNSLTHEGLCPIIDSPVFIGCPNRFAPIQQTRPH